ncbi:MAG: transporter substrate-binding domain-containing protein, partial [Deltaproteobacteria bacterium]|nr:transporter substrate-binding domain-containing protein [Deltaproteobacteria bacterium]
MRTGRHMLRVALAALLLPLAFSACERPGGQQRALPVYASFRDVPGVTEGEIRAIEALRQQRAAFVYGVTPGSEAFYKADGAIGGFAPLFCGWVTELVGIPFKPVLYARDSLLAGLVRREIDFTDEVGADDPLRASLHMTEALAERPVKAMRIAGSAPLDDIAALRPPRFVFLKGSAVADAVAARARYAFDAIFSDSFDAAYTLLKNGQADAFLAEDSAEAAFDAYSDVTTKDFFPLIFHPVFLSTSDPSLEPVLS